jgi:hypothetical protein
MKKLVSLSIALITLLLANAQSCPTSISVYGPSSELTAGDSLVFSALVNGGGSVSPTYNWMISAGTIMSGQGTSMIIVNTEGLAGMSVTATVELGGYPRECNTAASSTASIVAAATKIIAANYATPQALTASVQKFISETKLADMGNLQTAFIYVYAGAATTAAQLKAINTTIVSAFEKNNVYSFQYKIADGGKKKIASYEMYILPPGIKEPRPSE